MKLIGLTGKSGSGKSYFAEKLREQLKNTTVINIDNIFESIMNSNDVISKIYDKYGDEIVKNGKVDLDKILVNKEIFNTIYEMIKEKIDECVKEKISQYETERKR